MKHWPLMPPARCDRWPGADASKHAEPAPAGHSTTHWLLIGIAPWRAASYPAHRSRPQYVRFLNGLRRRPRGCSPVTPGRLRRRLCPQADGDLTPIRHAGGHARAPETGLAVPLGPAGVRAS